MTSVVSVMILASGIFPSCSGSAKADQNFTLDSIKKAVKKGEDVSLIGFGTFTKAKRKARTGVNPATGEQIKIKAKNVVKFKAGKAFKDSL